MGYLHIENLYRPQAQKILCFKHVYALEKIHGTSTHIKKSSGGITLFSGGESHDSFAKLFGTLYPGSNEILTKLTEIFGADERDITIFGEAYGGKCQGMRKVYGEQLRFIAFDVRIGDNWLDVPNAESICKQVGIDFVDYKLIPAEESTINIERDRPSEQARRNGCGDQIREGVVLRPTIEVVLNNGERLIAKHKRPEFSERGTEPPAFEPAKLRILEETNAIITEWVTEMRLTHVLDKLGNPIEYRFIPDIIKAMVEDIEREGSGEILSGPEVRKAIGHKVVQMYKQRIPRIIQN